NPKIMKLYSRLILSAVPLAIALPGAAFAAKGDRKKKKTEDANAVTFETADKDKDGFVTETEYVAAMSAKLDESAAKARFATLDKNADNKLSAEEYNAGNTAEPKKKKKKNQ